MVRIHQIAKAYHKRPSEILFPHRKNPQWMLAIDNVVFEYGYEAEVQEEVEVFKAKMKRENSMFEAFVKLLGGRLIG